MKGNGMPGFREGLRSGRPNGQPTSVVALYFPEQEIPMRNKRSSVRRRALVASHCLAVSVIAILLGSWANAAVAPTSPPRKVVEGELKVHLSGSGEIILPDGKTTLRKRAEKEKYLQEEYAGRARRARAAGKDPKNAGIRLIVVADRSAKYDDIFEILELAKRAGFTNLHIRAMAGDPKAPPAPSR